MAEIMTMAQEELRRRGAVDAKELAALAVTGEADGTALIDGEERIPTWRPRDYSTGETPVGTPYKWQGQVYRLWQQHDATGREDWSPDQAVSLWNVCHTTDPSRAKPFLPPQGSRGLYQAGECCIWEGQVWRSQENNNAYSPSGCPVNWEPVEED